MRGIAINRGKMSGSSPSLRELIDIDELQSIQDSFARAAGISSVIFSAEGEPLTRLTNPTGFCSLIQSTEKGRERCFRSFMEMGEIALGAEEPEICYCFAHSGHFVAPIIVDGEHKGTVFAGQFIPEKFSPEQLQNLEKIALEIDIDQGSLVKEAEKMRVVGEDVIRNYSSLLFKIVEIIARRGAQAAELESRVQERTAELAEANKGLKHEITERKLAEEALQKERDRAQHYLDVAGVMFLVIDADRKVSLINRKGCEILGYEEEEEITGKDWFDNFIPERLRDEVARVFGSLMAGEVEPVEYYENPVLTKHGEERIVAWHNTLLRDEPGRIYAIMASGEDITERKRIEKALNDRVEFEEIVTGISTGFINLAPDEVDAGIGDALQSIGEFAGVDRSYVFQFFDNRTTMDNTHEWCADGIVPQIGNLKGQQTADFPWLMGRLNRFETVHIPSVADLPPGAGAEKELLQSQDILSAIFVPMVYGRTLVGYLGFDSVRQGKRWSEDSTALLRIVGEIFVNVLEHRKIVLERKRAMTTLRESEEKIRAITASANDAVIMMGDEARITYWNHAAEQIFGYTEEEAIGRDLHKTIVPERFHDDFLKGVEVFIETGQGNVIGKSLELDAVRKDGTEFPIELSISAVKIAGSWNAIGLIKDTTERKRAEHEIENLQRYNRGLIEVSLDLLVTFDHKGIIRDVNRAMIQATGRTREELIGTPFADYFTDPERAYKGAMLAFEIGGVRDYELVMKASDGTETIVSYNTSIYRNQAGAVVGAFAAARDITERKSAEEEIKKKTEESEGFNKLAVGRELKMIELKKEINALLWKLGEKPEYEIAGES